MIRSTSVLVFLLLAVITLHAQNRSWQKTVAEGGGEITVYRYPNNIEVSQSKDVIDGVEQELFSVFIDFINAYYQLDVSVKWQETKSFAEVMNRVEQSEQMGVFGASSVSITPSRSKRFQFMPPYLSDVAVLISHPDVSVSLTEEQFLSDFRGATAITIPETTISEALQTIDSVEQLELNIVYVSNTGQIIEQVENTPNSYAYIDLPNFLVAFDNTTVKRQYFHPIKGEGLAFIYPLGSDWEEPISLYFNSDQFAVDRDRILNKYFGNEIGQIIRRVSRSAEFGPSEEIIVSQQEKELQYQELLRSAEKEQDRIRQLAWLWGLIISFSMLVILLVVRYRLKSRTADQLLSKQEEIEAQNQRLQKLDLDKNELLKIIAHDLRSPLTTVQGAAELLGKNGNLTEDELALNELSKQAIDRMKDMISKVLDANAIEQGKHRPDKKPVDLSALIGELLSQHREWADQKHINLKLLKEINPSPVHTDAFYLGQVLDNLLSNAIKFSERGGEVSVVLKATSDEIHVAICDKGQGISPEELPRVFEKYSKLSALPTAGEPSIGLGLSIVKSYVDLIDASIDVTSHLGEGSTFTVRIPHVEEHHQAPVSF